MTGRIDAVVCLSGDGLARVKPSVDMARKYDCVLVLAGSRDAPPDAYHWLNLLEYTATLPANRVVCVDALNTWEQAVNVIALARSRNWRSILVAASGHHCRRAFLTFVKAQMDHPDVVVHVLMVPSPRMETDEFMAEEDAKVELYRAKGHCATDEDVRRYADWVLR